MHSAASTHLGQMTLVLCLEAVQVQLRRYNLLQHKAFNWYARCGRRKAL